MADNITLDTGSGGSVVRTDDDGAAHWPYTKIAFGADNTQTIVASISSNPFPVALSATDNAVLDAIATAVEIIDNVVCVDNAAFTLGTSSVAVAGGVYQSGTPTSLADNDAGAILLNSTAGQMVELMASTVAIGKLAANSGVDIGDVDVTTVVPGTAATSLGKAEDAAHSSADVGVMALSVRQNTAASTSGADGDYQPLITDTNGRLHVNDVSTAAALSGSEFQVDVVAALPAGTNAIGKLAANSGVDIGDVDILSIAAGDNNIGNVDIASSVPGTGATNAGKAQDTAVGSTDTGVAMLVKRDDEEAAVTPVDGDYVVPTCDKFGKLKITQLPDATSVVKFAIINAASGDNSIVPAAGAGIKIRVLNVVCIAGGTTDCRFESGAGGTALTGVIKLVAQVGFAPGFCPVGHFETADNAALSLECTGDIDGWVSYVEV